MDIQTYVVNTNRGKDPHTLPPREEKGERVGPHEVGAVGKPKKAEECSSNGIKYR